MAAAYERRQNAELHAWPGSRQAAIQPINLCANGRLSKSPRVEAQTNTAVRSKRRGRYVNIHECSPPPLAGARASLSVREMIFIAYHPDQARRFFRKRIFRQQRQYL